MAKAWDPSTGRWYDTDTMQYEEGEGSTDPDLYPPGDPNRYSYNDPSAQGHWIPPEANFDTSNPSGVINAQNPNANPALPFVQAGTTGGYIDGIGVTVGQGRSLTPAQYQAALAAAIASGVPEGWATDFLNRNPLDANRITEAYNSGNSGGAAGSGGRGSSGGGGYNGGLAPPNATAGWMPTLDIPTWNAPAPFTYPDFVRPTLEQAQNEPGYKFALEQGQKALESAAGMKGILRTGGTARALLGYGQKMGEQNYQNVFNRELGVYGTNRTNAEDIYTKGYTAAKDTHNYNVAEVTGEYAPKKEEAIMNFNALMQQWLTKSNIGLEIFKEGARD